MATFVDLVKIQVLSAGTDPFTLGPAVEGFRGAAALIDGREYSYSVQQGANFEFGRGVYSQASGILTRAVLGSSRNGQPVDFGVGAVVTFTLLSADLEDFNPSNPVLGVGITAPRLGFTFTTASFVDGILILEMDGVLTPAGGGVPAGGLKYRINIPVVAAPLADEVLGLDVTDAQYTFGADFDGSTVYVGTLPTATTVFTIEKLDDVGSTVIGSLSISTAGVGTFETTDNEPVLIAAGEAVRVTGPTVPDATLADFVIKLVGTL
jgi:hypothetical protein